MQTDQNMVAYFFLEEDFDSKDSKWIFEMHFREEHFEEKFLFKNEKDDFQKTIFKHQT